MTKPKPVSDDQWLKCWEIAIEMYSHRISWRKWKRKNEFPQWWGRHHSRLVKRLEE